ncbi:M12 family metallo-peptidase, partial [Runella sp.]|uniref:M12 family metallo-peptidase n=1 Tax=Runella sp. TaxID=1960881 RepID=UPI0030179028
MIQFAFSKPSVLNYSKWVLFLVFIFLFQHVSSAQNRIVNQLNQVRATTIATKYTLFSRPLSSARLAADTSFVPGATVYRFDFNKETASLIENQPTPLLELSIPISATQPIDLELIPYTIFSPTFRVINARGETVAPQALGSYYHGIIKGDPKSSASISIINGEISGIISNKDGNYNLGKEPQTPNYIFYNDKDLRQKSNFTCATPDAPVKVMGQNLIKQQASLPNVACGSVEIYFEADYALYQAQGSSIPNTVSYVNSLFSNVATLYNNEGLSVVISEIKVWNTADPYAGTASTSAALTSFRTNVGTGFNGRLAHLLSGRNLGGGIAYIDVLCEKSYAYGVSASLSNTIVNLPVFSWNVEVVTHELGHNFGSPHTQSCTWPGGALDNCYTTEGGCAPGPAPTNGGTIMSYCHLTGYGINFANGFGTLPGNLIRNLTQACLGSAVPPTNLTTLEIYNTQALVSWTHEAGTYTVEYRPTSSSSWTVSGTTTAKNKYLTSLSPNTAYEWRVKVNCSDYAVGTFTTNSTTAPPLYCTTSHTNGCTYGILMTGVQLGGTTLSSASGCVSGGYNFITSPTKDLSLGQSVNFTINLEGYYNGSQLAIWIDLNKDYVFQANEKVFTTSAAITQALTGSFTVPFGSSLGKTRMRIVLNYSSAPTDPCGTYSYGETEDYYVNLTSLTCVTQFTVTGGGSFCAGGSGVAVGLSGSETGVNYQLKRNGSNTGAAIAGTGSALGFGLQNTAGTYTVEASAANCSATLMTGSAIVTVSAVPTLTSGTSTNPTTCGGTNGSIAFTTTNLPNGTYSLS